MSKNISKLAFSLVVLALALLILTPYFTTDFFDLRQKQETEELEQKILKEELARKKTQEEARQKAEQKIYLMGKFEPAQRKDFVLIPAEYTFGGNKMYLREEVYNAYVKMREAALKEKIDLRIVSAARNFNHQKELWNNKWRGKTLVEGKNLEKSIPNGLLRFEKILEYSAVPGTSRHHWGSEIDINGVSPTYFDTEEGKIQYDWLTQNAPLFGFCQTYNQKLVNLPGQPIRKSGYNEEKWHWSYLPLAKNFTQEYKNLIKEEDIKGFLGDEYVSSFDLINNYVLGINPDCL